MSCDMEINLKRISKTTRSFSNTAKQARTAKGKSQQNDNLGGQLYGVDIVD